MNTFSKDAEDTEIRLTRVRPGLYRCGAYTVRGIEVRSDGRQGSRINKWLISVEGRLVDERCTLARAREWLRVARGRT